MLLARRIDLLHRGCVGAASFRDARPMPRQPGFSSQAFELSSDVEAHLATRRDSRVVRPIFITPPHDLPDHSLHHRYGAPRAVPSSAASMAALGTPRSARRRKTDQ